MSNFIDDVLDHNKPKPDEPSPFDVIPPLDASFDLFRSSGLIGSTSFRLPVIVNPVLDEILKVSPYDSKGELVYSMLQSQICEFITALPDNADILNFAAESAIDKYLETDYPDEQKEIYQEIQEELL